MSLLLALITAQAIDTPRAEAVSLPVTFERVAPYQAQAFVPVVAPPVVEDVTLDKWQAYSVGTPPLAARPPSSTAAPVLADIVGENLVKWFTGSPMPAPAAARPASVTAAPVLADIVGAILNKWLTASPIPAPAARPQNTGAFSFVADFLTRSSWFTDSPLPQRVPPRAQSDPAFVSLVTVAAETVTLDKWQSYSVGPFKPPPYPDSVFAWSGFTPAPVTEGPVTLDKWLAYSAMPAPLAARPASSSVWPIFTPAPVETVTLDKWFAYSFVPPAARTLQNTGALAFVQVPSDISLLNWLTASPIPAPARRLLELSTYAKPEFTEPPPAEGPVTLDKWTGYTALPRFFPRVVDSTFVTSISQDPGVGPTPPQPPVSGGAGSGGRRQFPFRNRYDDPELFRRQPEPELRTVPRYVEGDPAQVVTKVPVPAGPSSLDELGRPARKPPPILERPRFKLHAAPALKPEPVLPPLSDSDEREEELLVLRMLGIL